MFNLIDSFYEPNDLGLMVMNFLNAHFITTHQSSEVYYGGNRIKGYPCYETKSQKTVNPNNPYCPCGIFIKTFEKKTGIKIKEFQTFFRKTKKQELKDSPSWKQYKQHTDEDRFDLAGVVYYNSNSLKDGTHLFNTRDDYEPTAIVGSRYNRCVFYNAQQPHSPSMEQDVEERWVQPFFIVTEKI